MATDVNFKSRVSEDSLIRVLNSFAWLKANMDNVDADRTLDLDNHIDGPDMYVQGMNVLAAPFMYIAETEAQAFTFFYTFLTRDCPLYIRPTLEGVHRGLKLVDICLEIIDPTLFNFLKTRLLTAELYAFASVLTFSACTPPLAEVLILWDFMFAYGPHMNILFVIAQLILMRQQLMESNRPISLLRSFPALKSKQIIKLAVSFVARIPDSVYELLKAHLYEPDEVYSALSQKLNR